MRLQSYLTIIEQAENRYENALRETVDSLSLATESNYEAVIDMAKKEAYEYGFDTECEFQDALDDTEEKFKTEEEEEG